VALVRRFYRARLEDRPGRFWDAGGHTTSRNK
jgi:hypothetical protein